MALFRISKGDEVNLPKLKREGFAYFTVDENDFYIDVSDSDKDAQGNFIKDGNGDPVGGERKQLNANRARYLKSKDLNQDGESDLYIDDEEFSLGRKARESYYESSFNGNAGGSKAGLRSIAIGNSASATGNYSSSFGSSTVASGINSHAEGSGSIAKGQASHAEGNDTSAKGDFSHAEGQSSKAEGQSSHAEGNSKATGDYSHSEGINTKSSAHASHAEGSETVAKGECAHAEGVSSQATGDISHAEGVSFALGMASHSEGAATRAIGFGSHAEGGSIAIDDNGDQVSEGPLSFPDYGIPEGILTIEMTTAGGSLSHAEGYMTLAYGDISHAEGAGNLAYGAVSHAEGLQSATIGVGAHAEGIETIAEGQGSHAEGALSRAIGDMSHAEGEDTVAEGQVSHSEGCKTHANGDYSHAQNQGTIANGDAQTAIGKYNIADVTSAFIIGKGTANDARSNAFSIDWNGNAFVANLITQGAPSTDPSLANFNRFNNDLFIGGNGIQNVPTVAGVYIGKEISTENRQISIVSGGTTSYIDFNKSAGTINYKVRLATNVETGKVEFLWDTNASNKELHVNGKLYLTQTPTNQNEATPKKYVDNFIKSVKEEFTGLTPYLVFTHGNNNTTRIQSDYRVLQSLMPSWDNWGSSKIPVLLSSPYKTVMNGGTNGTDITYWNDKFTFCPQTGYLEGVKIDCGAWEEYWMNQDDCCFEAGTQILVDLSGTTRNIEDMKPGDIAVAYDIQKGVNYLATVKETHVKYDTTDIAEVVFSNGSKLTMNAYHPIYTTTGWHSLTNHKNYDTLLLGDICRTESGWSEIVSINRYKSSNNITMYSLDLIDIDETNDNDVNDNFFANGIVVHNAACPT